MEILAVRRYREGRVCDTERGFYFEPNFADEAIDFFPAACRHSAGEWDGQPFKLSPWQKFIVWNVFGWRRKSDKTRRFRKVYISVARKNGKSTFCAALGLLLLCFDNPQEPAAEIYVAATKEAQAVIIHREACRMRDKSSSLSALIKRNKNNLYMPSNQSFFRPLGSDSNTTDGLNPHAVLKDELHEWREHHRGLHEKLSTGGASRRQPLEVIITTAGDDNSIIWEEEEEYARKVLESAITDTIVSDILFVYIASIDKQDDPYDEKVWPKANPNLGVSVKLEYLREQSNEAKAKPTAANAFKRYHCNRAVRSTEKAIDPVLWKACGEEVVASGGEEAYGGFDIGRVDDFASVGIVVPYDMGGDDEDGRPVKGHELLSWSFTSEGAIREMKPAPFVGWENHKRLIVNEGDTVSFAAVQEKILEVSKTYNVKSWAFDPTFAQQMAQELDEVHGLTVFSFTQAPRHYNEPIREFLRALKDGRIRHGGDELLGWQFGNLTIKKNYKDEWMPDKAGKTGAKQKGKIDAAVAMLMAFSETLFAAKKTTTYGIIMI